MSTIGERIRQVRLSIHPKPSQENFAKMCGATRNAYSEYEYGRVVPNDTFLQLVASKFGINYTWLKTGKGEMQEEVDLTEQLIDTIVERYKLDDKQKHTLRSFFEIEQPEQELLFKLSLLLLRRFYL